jgi:RluA family pseudouridine synthase
MLEWVIIAEDVGKKLVDFLTDRLEKNYSARLIKRALESNCCQVNGKTERFASTILHKKDHVCFNNELLKHSSASIDFQADRLIFEDSDLLVYNKPSGVTCDPEGILKILATHCPGLKLIHRLDKETTGVLMFAKNQKTFDLISELFKERKVKKQYLAIVEGVPLERSGTIKNDLGKISFFHGQTVWGAVSNRKGHFAHTDWECRKKSKTVALIACFPHTGRMHQIRVHLSEMGHPVLGDTQYAGKIKFSYHPPRTLLHAYEVIFEYKDNLLTLSAPLPDDFLNAEKKLFK